MHRAKEQVTPANQSCVARTRGRYRIFAKLRLSGSRPRDRLRGDTTGVAGCGLQAERPNSVPSEVPVFSCQIWQGPSVSSPVHSCANGVARNVCVVATYGQGL